MDGCGCEVNWDRYNPANGMARAGYGWWRAWAEGPGIRQLWRLPRVGRSDGGLPEWRPGPATVLWGAGKPLAGRPAGAQNADDHPLENYESSGWRVLTNSCLMMRRGRSGCISAQKNMNTGCCTTAPDVTGITMLKPLVITVIAVTSQPENTTDHRRQPDPRTLRQQWRKCGRQSGDQVGTNRVKRWDSSR